MIVHIEQIIYSLYRLKGFALSAVFLLVLTATSGCSSQEAGVGDGQSGSSQEPSSISEEVEQSSEEVEDSGLEEGVAEAADTEASGLAFSGSKDVVTHFDGYTFRYSWDWQLGDATSDVQNSAPGETESTVSNAGEATIENTTPGRTMDFRRSGLLVFRYYEDSSTICKALSTDEEVPGCWLKLGYGGFVDSEDTVHMGGFSLDDGETFTADFSVPDIDNTGVATQSYHEVDEDLAEKFIEELYEPAYVGIFTSMSVTIDDIEFETPETSDLCRTLLGGRGMDDLLMIGSSPELSCEQMDKIDDTSVD